jgi:tetratricopeptide (TPR) repeat protein
LQLARALRQLRRYDEAFEAFKTSERELEQHDVSPSSLRLRAILLKDQRRFSDALAAGQQAQSVEPGSALDWNQIGIALLSLGRPAEAYGHFIQATALKPRDPAYPNNVRVALAHLRQYDQALIGTNRALALRPGHLSSTISRADDLVSLERYEEAEAHLRAATEVTMGHSGYWAVMGSLHTRRADEALVSIMRAIDLSDDDTNTAVAYERMGELLIAFEDYPKALEFAGHGLELRPYGFWLQELKAKALRGLGRESEADEIERTVQTRLAKQLALLAQAEGANGECDGQARVSHCSCHPVRHACGDTLCRLRAARWKWQSNRDGAERMRRCSSLASLPHQYRLSSSDPCLLEDRRVPARLDSVGAGGAPSVGGGTWMAR